MIESIAPTILKHFPTTVAIYLFGSYATTDERVDSDVDLALMFPHGSMVTNTNLALSACKADLEMLFCREVDLLNLRSLSTVFQKEIVMTGRLLFLSDRFAVDEFEMLTISYYQKLNEERADILAEIKKTGTIIA